MDQFDAAARQVVGGEFEQAAGSVMDDQRTKLRASLYTGLMENPDQVARAQSLGKMAGLPRDVVQRNLPEVERTLRMQDVTSKIDETPTLARWLSEQENAAIAHDNVENMGQFERKLRQFGGGAVEAVGMSLSGTGVLADVLQRTAINDFASIFLPEPKRGPMGLEPQKPTIESLAGPLIGAGARQAGAEVKSFARDDVMVPASQRTFSDQVAGGLGQVVGQITMLPFTRGAGLYTQGADVMAEKVAGDDADQRTKDLAVLGGAAVTGLTEQWALDKLLGPMAVPIKNQVAASLARIGIAAAAEGGQEFSENVLQDTIRKALTNRDAEIDIGQSVEEGGVGAVVGGIVRSVVESALHIRVRGERRAQKAEQDAQAVAEMNQIAAADKVLQRNPEAFEQFVKQAAEDGPVPVVYIDANALMQSGVAEQVANVSASVAEQITEAVAIGGQIAIPVEEYAARIAPTEYAQSLIDHIKTEPDGFSRMEAQQFMETQGEQLQAEVERTLAEKQADSEFQASKDTVKIRIKEELDAIGRFTPEKNEADATLFASYYAVRAAQLGITPEAMYQQRRVKFAAESLGGQELNQVAIDTPEFSNWFGDSKVVDANGEPLVVYHGTTSNVQAFDRSRIGQNYGDEAGFFFTENPGNAGFSYASGEGGNVMPVFLSLKKPLVVKVDEFNPDRAFFKDRLEIMESARLGKNDGVIVEDKEGNKMFVAFRPEQIKSATGNRGTFDPNDPNILNQGARGAFSPSEGMYRQAQGKVLYQSAYHGTPHRGIQKFSTDKIGTGEGAQAYGWGLYFASKREIAEWYRGGLTYREMVRKFRDAMPDDADTSEALDWAESDEAPADMARVIKELSANDWLGFDYPSQALTALFKEPENFDISDDLKSAAAAMQGQLYEVDIPEDSEMLLWDKPLSEQPKFIQGAVDDAIRTAPGADETIISRFESQGMGMTGEEIYKLLSGRQLELYGQRGASEHLASFGVKGIKYLDGTSRTAGDGSYNYVVFSGDDVEITNQYYQQARGAFSPESFTITLLKGADLTTDLHEGAHFFFENDIALAAELVNENEAFGADTMTEGQRQIIADVSALLKWHGINGTVQEQLAQWYQMDFEQKRVAHERTAESFEAYLFDGKAPSLDLQPYFQKFRAWMVSVYKSLKAFLTQNPEAGKLDDTVRQVFDRMLASSEQIKLAEQSRSMFPLFANPEEAGMTVEEFAAYQAQGIQPTADAIEELQAKGVRDLQWLRNARGRELKKLQKRAAVLRAQARIEARREIMSQPVYRAWQFLTGRLSTEDRQAMTPEAPKSSKGLNTETDSLFVAIAKLGGLDRDAVERAWGWDANERTPQPAFGQPLLRRQDGLSIEAMAERLQENGYLARDDDYMAEFEAKFDAEYRGDPQYSIAYEYARSMERRAGDSINLEAMTAGRLEMIALQDMGLPPTIPEFLSELGMTAKNGIHPDLVAELFGFTSGDELVRTLAAAEKPAEAIESLTDRLMLERNGELATPEAIEQAADMAIHNAARARMVATEYNALAKATGQPKVLTEAAREFARGVVARVLVRNLKPSQYANAAARAGQNAMRAQKSGDVGTAAAEKRNQLVQTLAAREAHNAREEIDKGVDYLRKFEKATVRKGLDQDYIDQIDQMLERFDLKKSASLKDIDRRKSLAEWLTAQREAGMEPDIPERLENEAFRKSYKDMTVEEFRGMVDTIRQIEHLGRLKRRLLTARDEREFRALADEAAATIRENGGKVRELDLEADVTLPEKFLAGHRKLASLIRQMDGGKDDGVLWNLLGRSMNERGTQEAVANEKATMALTKIFQPVVDLKGGLNGDKRFIPEIGNSLTRGGRLSVALNWGNTQNRQRIMDGDGWTDAQVKAILRTLTPVEAQFVNNVWEYIDTFWPEVAAKEKRLTGKEPEKVLPEPFDMVLADGSVAQMRGGYYPLKYDAARDDMASKQLEAEVAADMKRGAFTRATTRRGHTKQRVENVKRPVRKSLDVITQHVTQVTHDLAWHEWLVDANRIIDDRAVNQAIRDHYGPAVIATIKDGLSGIATADVVPQTAMDQVMLYLRSNVSRSTMGWSLTTAFLQPFGLTQSMVRIGPRYVLRGLKRWGGDVARFESGTKWIYERSDFMRLRDKTFNRELHEINGRINQGKSRAREIYDASLFMMMQKMQRIADVPTWYGAYEKAIEQGADEAKAVAMADQAVLDSQGGGQTKDMAELQRKHPMLSMFYSYFNVTYNLAAESTARTDFRNPQAVAGWMSDMLLLMIVPALGPAIVMELLRGGGDDEPEEWAKKLAEWQAGYLLGTMLGARELSGVVAGYDYTGPPVGRVIGDIGKAGVQISQGEADEALGLSVVRLFGTALGIPTVQIIRSWRGWNAWSEGDAPPTAVLLGPPPQD